jgi:hypothetical protein
MNVDSFIKGFASGLEKRAMSPQKLSDIRSKLTKRYSAIHEGDAPAKAPRGKSAFGPSEEGHLQSTAVGIGRRLGETGKKPKGY